MRRWPTSTAWITLHLLCSLGLGAGILYLRLPEQLFTLLIPPIVLSTLHYPRHVYLFGATFAFTLAILFTIPGSNNVESTLITILFIFLAVILSTELMYRLVQERRKMILDLETRQKYLDLLNQLTLMALETDDLKSMLQKLADILAILFKADHCFITLWEPETRTAIPMVASGSFRDTYAATPYMPGDLTLTQSVLELGRSLAVEDVLNSPYVDPAIASLFTPQKSILVLPLMAKDQKFGAALIGFNQKHTFAQEDIAKGEQTAGVVALAMAKARLYQDVQRLAIIDELTGVYNRRGLMELGRREVERAIRSAWSLAAIFIDIDHFKSFNDTYSYAIGDQVLRVLSQTLKKNLREVDVIGRYGGEEFVVLLPDNDLRRTRRIAERLRHECASMLLQSEQGDLSITISVGVAILSQGMSHNVPLENHYWTQSILDDLIAQAAQALHYAKESGRNRVMIG